MGETAAITSTELFLAAMLGMFLLALGVVFFFLAYQRRIIKQQKEHQAKEAEYQQQLMRANLLSQEKERNRIGKDLHDGVGAMLTTAKLYFRHLDQDVAPEKFTELKEKAFGLLEETMVSVRRVSHDLRPVVLERLGLVEAIANTVDQINQAGEIRIEFRHSEEAEPDKEYQLNWYRIIQELITNTLKHAGATVIHIDLTGTADQLQVVYQDDGVGLTRGEEPRSGLGIQNIESRLGLMGGTLEFLEKEGSGIYLEMISSLRPDPVRQDESPA